MDFDFSDDDERFRKEVQAWMADHLVGEYDALGKGQALGEGEELEVRKAWERELASGGWVGLGWPAAYGGREATFTQELIFHEEYVKGGGPNRVGWFGENLLGPTLIAFGSEAQKQRFLPKILSADEFWCQGFSEPDAGSDLANVKTSARLDGDEWVINGQKVWTSLGHIADWIFVVCRTDPAAPKKHQGISFLLCPMDQPGVELRPIVQPTGSAEFNEVFLTDARTRADLVVGEPNQGWQVVMGTLGFERGTAFMGEMVRWGRELQALRDAAQARGLTADPRIRQRIADVHTGLQLARLNGLRSLSGTIHEGEAGPVGAIGKLQWSHWHQRLGDLAMDVLGADATLDQGGEAGDLQHAFLFSRAETIFAGSSEIQRNVIGERHLGLPREPA